MNWIVLSFPFSPAYHSWGHPSAAPDGGVFLPFPQTGENFPVQTPANRYNRVTILLSTLSNCAGTEDTILLYQGKERERYGTRNRQAGYAPRLYLGQPPPVSPASRRHSGVRAAV